MSHFLDYLWSYLDWHATKVVYVATVILCCYNVNAVNLMILIMALTSIWVLRPNMRRAVFLCNLVFMAGLIIAQMIYQTDFVPHIPDDTHNCSQPNENSTNKTEKLDRVTQNKTNSLTLPEWVGLGDEPYLMGYIYLILAGFVWRAIHLNLAFHHGERFPDNPVMFPGIRRENVDFAIIDAVKYIVNYIFYKFGLEICQVGMAVVCYVRRDVFAPVYGICLLLTVVVHKRIIIKRTWPLFCCLFAAATVYQYVIALGPYPSLCLDYPWMGKVDHLERWLSLPQPIHSPDTTSTISDAILLLLMRQQSIVLILESRRHWIDTAGSNGPIYQLLDDPFFPNPVPDHTLHEWIWIDLAKFMVIACLYWGSLAVSFMAGLGADLLSIGYLAGAFFIIWKGNDLYLRSAADLLKWWRLFCAYAVISIVLKCSLTGISCQDKAKSSSGWYWASTVVTGPLCKEGNSFVWELLVLAFLLVQMRFFQSPYFIHQVNDVKAAHKLQSSGAALIKQLREEKTMRAKEALRDIVLRLKEDMENIKEYHQRILNPDASGPTTHDEAVMAGDYYMFQGDVRFRSLVANRRSSDYSTKQKTYEEFIEQKKLEKKRSYSNKRSKSEVIADTKDNQEEELMLAYEKGSEEEAEEESIEEEESLSRREKVERRMSQVFSWIKGLINGYVIPFLNKASFNYRLVAWAMKKDKAILKKQGIMSHSEEIPIVANMEEFQSEEEKKQKETNAFLKLLDALWFALQAHTELLCYLAVFVHQLMLPSLLSLPMPLMVLMWGALTPEQPSQTFWTTITAYSQISIIIKCLFRNEAFPWRRKEASLRGVSITYPPSVIGIDQIGLLASADVIVLIMLFMHRRNLKNHGLWTEDQRHHTNRSKPVATTSSTLDTVELQVKGPPPLPQDSLRQHFKPMKEFFWSFKRETTFPDDVYSYCFLCEFLTFLIIIFGFSSFSPQAASGTEKFYLVENEVPLTYLITIIIQFVIIIVDRVIYLKKDVKAKLIFHLITVLLAHVWIFLVLPTVTSRRFTDLVLPQVWYTFKYISFLLSTYQLRKGFPLRVGAHFLCGKYNKLHYFAFKGLKFVPFFNFLRSLVNWLCYKTSLNMFQWLTLCSMNSVIYETKCQRNMIMNNPEPRGKPVGFKAKALTGGWLLILLLIILLLPLILFFILNTISQPSPPTKATYTIRINAFQDLYFYEMTSDQIKPIAKAAYNQMKSRGQDYAKVRLFLDQYDAEDVSVLKLSPASRSAWTISPAEIEQMKEILNTTQASLTMKVSWELQSQESSKKVSTSSGEYETTLSDEGRNNLTDVLSNLTSNMKIVTAVPLSIENKNGHANAVMFGEGDIFKEETVQLTLKSEEGQMWWEVHGFSPGSKTPVPLTLNVFSSKQVPGLLNIISGKGILGLYFSIIAIIGLGFLKNFIESMYQTIKYYKLPHPDPVLQLSKDIYLARESEELQLEEDLYAKLKFLFRSPETMIKWTRFMELDGRGLQDEEGIANDIEL